MQSIQATVAEAAARTLFTHVRSAFDPAVLRELRRHLEAVQVLRQAQTASERERRAVERGESSDALRLDQRWFDAFRAPSPTLLDAIGPHHWVVYPPQVRHVRSAAHGVPWHQDVGYQRLLGTRAHRHHVTCFIPLDEDPERRPTIQFLRAALPELQHRPRAGFGAGIAELPEGDLVHYHLALGDALIFGDLALHRTFAPDASLLERRSLEFRLVRPEDSLGSKDYFDVRATCFTRRALEALP